MSHSNLEEQLLNYINQPGYRPAKPRAIARQLGLSQQKTEDLKKVVKRLIKAGRLAYGASHLLLPVQTAAVRHACAGRVGSRRIRKRFRRRFAQRFQKRRRKRSARQARRGAVASLAHRHGPNHMTGVFRRAQAGFGFVRPADSLSGADRKLDVFIPADKARDASSGDTVLVRLQKTARCSPPQPGRRSGRSARARNAPIRRHLFRVGRHAYVQVDGKVFSAADPSAIRGPKMPSRMTKSSSRWSAFPSHVHDGEGVISEVLGPRGDAGGGHDVDHPRVQPARAFRRRRPRGGPRRSRPVRRIDRPGRTDLTGET